MLNVFISTLLIPTTYLHFTGNTHFLLPLISHFIRNIFFFYLLAALLKNSHHVLSPTSHFSRTTLFFQLLATSLETTTLCFHLVATLLETPRYKPPVQVYGYRLLLICCCTVYQAPSRPSITREEWKPSSAEIYLPLYTRTVMQKSG